MTASHQRLEAAAAALMVLLCCCWGLNQVAVKLANHGISPVMQAGIRSIGSAILVFGWMAWRRVPLFERDGSLGWGIAVGLLFAGEFVFLYWGLVFGGASRTVLFLYMAPFTVAIGAHLFVPGERLTQVKILGLLSAFAGLFVAFGDALRLPGGNELFGDTLSFAGGVLWGMTTVMVKATRLIRINPAKTLLYQLAVSAVVLPLVSLAFGERGIVDLSVPVVGALAFQIVLVSFASYLTWFWLMTRYPASSLSAFTMLTPLFGLLAGWQLLGEPITAALLVAMGLVVCGIYLVNRPAAPVAAPAPAGD
ncbi:MAG TPA: DMT family transporter [Candidatus Cybelea sp.]|nr:DMT family transporter [Candidatus Cybelea sp.]